MGFILKLQLLSSSFTPTNTKKKWKGKQPGGTRALIRNKPTNELISNKAC